MVVADLRQGGGESAAAMKELFLKLIYSFPAAVQHGLDWNLKCRGCNVAKWMLHCGGNISKIGCAMIGEWQV